MSYLLCRPNNGINDMFNQIELCWRYAQAFDRTLILDTNHKTPSCFFRCDFDIFFQRKNPQDDVVLWCSPNLWRELEQLKTHSFAQGKLHSYFLHRDCQHRFNMDKKHDLPLLIHHVGWGGILGAYGMNRVVFTNHISQAIKRRLQHLPSRYHAIHIRHTDMRTKYKLFCEQLKPELDGQNLLVCSDNFSCLQYARQLFKNTQIFTVSSIPDLNGHGLHGPQNAQSKLHSNLDAFTDLMALSGAVNLYYPPKEKTHGKYRHSGFAMLAKALQQSPSIRNELLHQ